MDDGIIGIELQPNWDAPAVRGRLARSLNEGTSLQAAVAYWTVDPDLISPLLAPRLSAAGSYLCVDVHLPTDIDQLACIARRGANVRIFCEDIKGAGGAHEPPYLLHSKMLLFATAEGAGELWVGSHNWTNRALLGLNIESSLVVRCKASSALFLEAASYLEQVKSICEVFDLDRVDFYKRLQGDRNEEEKAVPFIELEGPNAGELEGSAITVFGTNAADLRDLGALRDIYLSMFDESDGTESIYTAKVLQAGVMTAYTRHAAGLNFSARRHAFRGGRFPRLLPIGGISNDAMQNSVYFVTVNVMHLVTAVRALDRPRRTTVWRKVAAVLSPLLRRIAPEDSQMLFQNRRPVVRLPAQYDLVTPREPTLFDRRELADHGFVIKKILRRRE